MFELPTCEDLIALLTLYCFSCGSELGHLPDRLPVRRSAMPRNRGIGAARKKKKKPTPNKKVTKEML